MYKNISMADMALCHAIGQACGVVHTRGHALGFSIYELTSIVRKYGIDQCREAVEIRARQYEDKLLYWAENAEEYSGPWAKFLEK